LNHQRLDGQGFVNERVGQPALLLHAENSADMWFRKVGIHQHHADIALARQTECQVNARESFTISRQSARHHDQARIGSGSAGGAGQSFADERPLDFAVLIGELTILIFLG